MEFIQSDTFDKDIDNKVRAHTSRSSYQRLKRVFVLFSTVVVMCVSSVSSSPANRSNAKCWTLLNVKSSDGQQQHRLIALADKTEHFTSTATSSSSND